MKCFGIQGGLGTFSKISIIAGIIREYFMECDSREGAFGQGIQPVHSKAYTGTTRPVGSGVDP